MSLRHTLLGILDWVPSHGYALREMAKGYNWIYPMSNANIYPALRELESEGFVCHREEVRDGRLRKIYSITDAGREELLRWLGDSAAQRGVYRDPALLKICLLRPGTHADAAGWIEDEMKRSGDVADAAQHFLEQHSQMLPKYTRLVAEHGRDVARLRARWLQRILEEARSDAASAAG